MGSQERAREQHPVSISFPKNSAAHWKGIVV